MSGEQQDPIEDEFRAALEQRLGVSFDDPENAEPDEQAEGDDAGLDDGQGDGEDQGEPEPSQAPESQADPLIELAPGISIPRESALSYWQFESILRADPELRRTVDERIRLLRGETAGGGSASPHEPSPVLPELDEDSLEDPALKALYDYAKAQQQHNAALEQRVRQLSDVTISRESEELAALVTREKDSFQKSHSLTPDEMNRVESVALRLNVVPALMQGVDPVTGAAVPRDRTAAIQRAYEIAYYWLPEFREREFQAAVQDRAKSQQRKQRMAGIGGSSGSVPKQAPALRTEADRRKAMIAEVATMMGMTPETE